MWIAISTFKGDYDNIRDQEKGLKSPVVRYVSSCKGYHVMKVTCWMFLLRTYSKSNIVHTRLSHKTETIIIKLRTATFFVQLYASCSLGFWLFESFVQTLLLARDLLVSFFNCLSPPFFKKLTKFCVKRRFYCTNHRESEW